MKKTLAITTAGIATAFLLTACGTPEAATPTTPTVGPAGRTAEQVVTDCTDQIHDWASIDIPLDEEHRISDCAYAQGANPTEIATALDFYLDGA